MRSGPSVFPLPAGRGLGVGPTPSRRVLERTGRAAPDDGLAAGFPLVARLGALGGDAPLRTRMAPALAAPFAAAERVVGRVLAGAAVVRLAALPPHAPGLADADVHAF